MNIGFHIEEDAGALNSVWEIKNTSLSRIGRFPIEQTSSAPVICGEGEAMSGQ